MEKEFITYEQALALKELGFDEQCMRYYSSKNGGLLVLPQRISTMHNTKNSSVEKEYYCSAPLYQQAFRWFRDVHELEGVPQKADSFSWFKFCIWKYTSNGKHRVNDAFDFEHKTYEEAESACLDKLIEICKNK